MASKESYNTEIIAKDITGSYIAKRNREKTIIRKALREGKTITYCTNFIEIDGRTYNGWNQETVEELLSSN